MIQINISIGYLKLDNELSNLAIMLMLSYQANVATKRRVSISELKAWIQMLHLKNVLSKRCAGGSLLKVSQKFK